MNVQEIVAEIPKLSFEDRLALIETLTQSLRGAPGRSQRKVVPASKLRGVLKNTQPPPTDEDIKQEYISYLEEKYT